MLASFHSNGTIPSSNDKLNTAASGMLICSQLPIVIWEESTLSSYENLIEQGLTALQTMSGRPRVDQLVFKILNSSKDITKSISFTIRKSSRTDIHYALGIYWNLLDHILS